MKQLLKRLLPKQVHYLYNRIVSRRKIRARYSDWFDLNWKQKASRATDSEWKEAYDLSWENWGGHDLAPVDLERIGELVGQGEGVQTLLDAGCGDGYLLASLTGRGFKLAGVDLSEKAIVRARERLGNSVEFQAAFLEKLPFEDKTFDVVVSTHTLEHVRDLDAAVSELRRVCRGRLIILVPRQEYLPYTEDYHVHFFPTEAELRSGINFPGAKVESYSIPPGVCAYNGEVWLMWGAT